jgi:hypothetical protein
MVIIEKANWPDPPPCWHQVADDFPPQDYQEVLFLSILPTGLKEYHIAFRTKYGEWTDSETGEDLLCDCEEAYWMDLPYAPE